MPNICFLVYAKHLMNDRSLNIIEKIVLSFFSFLFIIILRNLKIYRKAPEEKKKDKSDGVGDLVIFGIKSAGVQNFSWHSWKNIYATQ